MFKPNLVVQVIEEACVGCNQCVNVCPSGALSMDIQRRKAVLEEPRCVGCMKCVEQCIPYGAIGIQPNPDGRQLGIPPEDRDEAAAAIADGITAPEDITMATGVRAACGWLCLTSVTRLLEASGNPLSRPKQDYRIYPDATKVAIWNIPDGI